MLTFRVTEAAKRTIELLDYPVFAIPEGDEHTVVIRGRIDHEPYVPGGSGPWQDHGARLVYTGEFYYRDWYCIEDLGCAQILDYQNSWVKSATIAVDGKLHATAIYDDLHQGVGMSLDGVSLNFVGNS